MRSLKRLFDIGASVVGLVLLSPVLVIIALAIKQDSPGPVLFRQKRVGRKGQTFDIYKFRTMGSHTSGEGPPLTVRDDARITRSGMVLRRYKLDELPQLFNVILGDMSLVGPRPEVPKYADKWDDSVRRILLSVRPGLSDPASILFRNENQLLELSDDPERKYIDEIAPLKNRLSVDYVQKWSLWLDIKILFKTLEAILRSDTTTTRRRSS